MAVFNVDSALFSDPQSQQYDLNIDPGVDLMIVNVVEQQAISLREISLGSSAIR